MAAAAVRSKPTAAAPTATTATTATTAVPARRGDTGGRERYKKRDRCDLQAASESSSVHNFALAPLKNGIRTG
jgi:hypothetical protein